MTDYRQEPPPPLFAQEAQRRDSAIDRAASGAADFIDAAIPVGVALCQSRQTWIVDDLQDALAARGVPQPREPRAIGAVVRALVKEGWCEGTDEYRPSARPGCHCNPRRVWKSKVKP